MGYTFAGTTKLIILTSGTTTLDVKDMYSRWKDWLQTEPSNTKFLPAFRVVGGDSIDEDAGTAVTLYAFLANDWRIRPQEANHKLVVSNGVLAVDGGGDPFVSTVGTYNVLIQYSQPIRTETVATGGGSGGEKDWTDTERKQIRNRLGLDGSAEIPSATPSLATELWSLANGVEAALTPIEALRRIAAIFGGLVSGGPDKPLFKGMGVNEPRVYMEADANGNRSKVEFP